MYTNQICKPHTDHRASQGRASKARRGWPFPDPQDDLNNLILAMCAAALCPSLVEMLASPTNPTCKVIAIAAVIGSRPEPKPPAPGLQPA